jgi:hypothetical protein
LGQVQEMSIEKRGRFLLGYTDIASWRTIPGSCTGNNTANMLFPTGATQGSFICVNNSQYDAILAKWPA